MKRNYKELRKRRLSLRHLDTRHAWVKKQEDQSEKLRKLLKGGKDG